MTEQTLKIPQESVQKIGSVFTPTQSRSLDNKTGDFLLYAKRHTGVMIPDIEEILSESVDLIAYITSMGHPVRLPQGIFSIVILTDDNEFSDVGMNSRLFPKEILVPYVFNESAIDWGYQFISSGKIRRSLRKRLSVERVASKIKNAHETSIFRYRHSESYRKHGE
jgi:hypothetical protein